VARGDQAALGVDGESDEGIGLLSRQSVGEEENNGGMYVRARACVYVCMHTV